MQLKPQGGWWTTPAELFDGWKLRVFKAHARPPARMPSIFSGLVAVSGPPGDHRFAALLLFPQPQQWSLQGIRSLKPATDSCFSNWVPQSSEGLSTSSGSARGAEENIEGGRACPLQPLSRADFCSGHKGAEGPGDGGGEENAGASHHAGRSTGCLVTGLASERSQLPLRSWAEATPRSGFIGDRCFLSIYYVPGIVTEPHGAGISSGLGNQNP